jgi:AraC-like DNA-binding protein
LILKVSELSQSSQNKPARSWDTYNRILLYLRKNYFRIKTIEELASEVNVDPAYLSRVFRRFHNESPYKFLIRLKMGHAASLLLSSRRLVKDIAYELGFENPFHFSRTFKSVYGVSPENFI